MRRARLAAAVAAVVAVALFCAPGPASASPVIPLPLPTAPVPTVAPLALVPNMALPEGITAGLGIGATTGAVTTGAAFLGVAGAGLGAGYAIGWAGIKGVGFIKDQFFTDHPPAASTSGTGTADVVADPNSGLISSFRVTLTSSVNADWLTVFTVQPGYVHPNGATWDKWGQCNAGSAGGSGMRTWSAGTVLGGSPSYSGGGCGAQASTITALRLYSGGNMDVLLAEIPVNPTPQAGYQLRTQWSCQDPGGNVTAHELLSDVFGSTSDAPASFPEATCLAPEHLVSVAHGVLHVTKNAGQWVIDTTSPGDRWSPPAGSPVNDPASPYWTRVGGNPSGQPDPWRYANPDGSPWTGQPNPSTGVVPTPRIDWGPVSYPWPDTYAYPKPGAIPASDPSAEPVPSPSASPVPTAPPKSGDVTDPRNPLDPTDDPSNDCWPKGWGLFNPLEWVYKPVTCAWKWAMVPDADAQADVKEQAKAVEDLAESRVPASYVLQIPGWGGALTSLGQTCPDWRIKVGTLDQNIVCGSSFTSAIRGGRAWISVMMIALAFAPFLRAIWYAAFPILRITPGK